ncbi:50S ribosomal protein L4 [Desulfurivibrio alkaliphilus]|uniref:Large ribosomal subunit protein uL4 n=1 Tax=Desulfurivibrio alkaliphilus (strain DSM 19089 / UNIQEM U267 / AHT2) TaxID=589865 RepID=D6Z3M1_DESAT|nr:50S ribosomal protein L4 [Desulfurivibrio alkaliphilus]ADH86146.1 ribosomal protein L4/L1e [Desulfurivibrio alkaliphilus AHT 2]
MAVTEVYNIKKEKVGDVELDDALFGVEVNPHLLHDIVRMQRANRRAGTACTKTRKDVSGSGKKPWRQKGTGRARAGSRKSPVWRGGGTVFGPRPRSYAFSMPRKARKLGLRMALSSRCADNLLVVLDDFQLDEIKTKKFVEVMDGFSIDNALIVVPESIETLERSSRNVPGFKVMPTEGLNVYDILLHKHIVLLQPCIEQLRERLLT